MSLVGIDYFVDLFSLTFYCRFTLNQRKGCCEKGASNVCLLLIATEDASRGGCFGDDLCVLGIGINEESSR
jgi:hypothetical protein